MNLKALVQKWASSPPSWGAIQLLQIGLAVLSGAFAIWGTERVSIMLNSAIFGSAIAAITYIHVIKFYQRSWKEVWGQCREIMDMNRALIENRVAMHFAEMESDDDDAPGPTLN